jgi:hypothetical protein
VRLRVLDVENHHELETRPLRITLDGGAHKFGCLSLVLETLSALDERSVIDRDSGVLVVVLRSLIDTADRVHEPAVHLNRVADLGQNEARPVERRAE